MNAAAGIVAIVFGLLHALPSVARIRAPKAPRGSHEPAAVPPWARILWLVLTLATVAGGVVIWAASSVGGATVASLGAIGVLVLAIANGFWIHGRPTVRHHIVRGIAVVLVVALAILAVT